MAIYNNIRLKTEEGVPCLHIILDNNTRRLMWYDGKSLFNRSEKPDDVLFAYRRSDNQWMAVDVFHKPAKLIPTGIYGPLAGGPREFNGHYPAIKEKVTYNVTDMSIGLRSGR